MEGWLAFGLRFAAYIDVLLLAGLALGGGLGARVAGLSRRTVGWLAGVGVAIAIAQFGNTSLAMTGGDAGALDSEMLTLLLLETPMGISSLVRTAALAALVLIAATGLKRRQTVGCLAVVALASFAWTGHAAATEGAIGWLHRGSDVVHLIASAVWLGALALLLRGMFFGRNQDGSMVAALEALRRFSTVGTIVVASLIVTGTINLLGVTGIDALPALIASDYGRVLAVKLAVFGVMLGLAGVNRWRLVPWLERTLAAGDMASAATRLRASIATEIVLALVVLAAVAVLGTLSPGD